MHYGKSVDGAAFVLEDASTALAEVHLHPLDVKSYMVACQPEGGLDDLARPQRSNNGHRFRASAEVHGAQQPCQAKEMVTVQVRDNYGGNAL